MTKRGNSDDSPHPITSTHYSQAPIIGNMAVQASLMQIFDEFTEVISGELKSMNLEEAEKYRAKRGKSAL